MTEPPADETLLRPPLWQVATVSLVSAAVLFVTMGASAHLFNLAWGIWFSEALVFFSVPFVALQVTGRAPFRLTGLDQPAPKALAVGVVVGVVNYAALAVPLMWLSEQLFPPEVIARYSAARLFERQSGLELAIVLAGVSLAAPFCEEFLYRGLVQPGLGSRLSPERRLVLTALLFSLMHFDPVGFLARFELGLVFGLLAWRSGSLWPAIGAHAANNLTSLVVFFLSNRSDPELSGLHIAGLTGGGLLALVGLVAWLGRWRGWVAPKPGADEEAPFVPFFRALTPWVVGAVLALIGLAVVDRRGVELNIIDVMHPVKSPGKDASPGEREAWQELERLRARVRRGEGGLDEYRSLRQLAAEKPGAKKDE